MASCDSVCEMPSADRLDEPSLLSLPDDLLVQLFYRLDNQRDVCMFELVSKESAMSCRNSAKQEERAALI